MPLLRPPHRQRRSSCSSIALIRARVADALEDARHQASNRHTPAVPSSNGSRTDVGPVRRCRLPGQIDEPRRHGTSQQGLASLPFLPGPSFSKNWTSPPEEDRHRQAVPIEHAVAGQRGELRAGRQDTHKVERIGTGQRHPGIGSRGAAPRAACRPHPPARTARRRNRRRNARHGSPRAPRACDRHARGRATAAASRPRARAGARTRRRSAAAAGGRRARRPPGWLAARPAWVGGGERAPTAPRPPCQRGCCGVCAGRRPRACAGQRARAALRRPPKLSEVTMPRATSSASASSTWERNSPLHFDELVEERCAMLANAVGDRLRP